jgi:hypothetical protein
MHQYDYSLTILLVSVIKQTIAMISRSSYQSRYEDGWHGKSQELLTEMNYVETSAIEESWKWFMINKKYVV